MNPDFASQLNSAKLSTADIQNLMKTLSKTSLGKKGASLTPQDKNNLLSRMSSSTNSAEYMVEKEDPTKNPKFLFTVDPPVTLFQDSGDDMVNTCGDIVNFLLY